MTLDEQSLEECLIAIRKLNPDRAITIKPTKLIMQRWPNETQEQFEDRVAYARMLVEKMS